jgi:hypothetical protein
VREWKREITGSEILNSFVNWQLNLHSVEISDRIFTQEVKLERKRDVTQQKGEFIVKLQLHDSSFTCNLLGGTHVTFSTRRVQQPTVSASSSSYGKNITINFLKYDLRISLLKLISK